ncbi:MAG: carbohydrate ABC transporter permease [Chloroflexota bacterium]
MSQATYPYVRYRMNRVLGSSLYYLGLAVFTIIVLVPFYWMARASVSNQEQILMSPPLYFPTPTFENFGIVAEQVPLVLFIGNSIIFSTASAVIAILTSFMAAYAFTRIKVRGSGFLQWILIITVAIPQVSLIIPLYQILLNMKLLNSLTGLILVFSSLLTPFTVWVLMSFINQVPQEIEEAAIIDGASLLQVLWRIVIPVTTPGIVTMMVINFINGWNDLLHPLSFSSTEEAKTLSVAITYIYSYRASWGLPWNLVSTVGMIMVIPVIIMVIFAQRSIVSGLTRGAIK